MLNAFINSDARYNGKFYVAVKSTKIYCLPSCTAKQPLEKNILFFDTQDEAISAGFRGCLRCRSEFYPNIKPDWFENVNDFIKSNKHLRIREFQLEDIAGVDITTIRRYFKYYHHMTPLSYHRKIRLNFAKELIRNGTNQIIAAYQVGYESMSGFRDAFVKEFSITPGEINGHRKNTV
jgi:AraC family transcriptional regulator of adaptative response/methylated-DNA-[protein]-cysteine methyltransferase